MLLIELQYTAMVVNQHHSIVYLQIPSEVMTPISLSAKQPVELTGKTSNSAFVFHST